MKLKKAWHNPNSLPKIHIDFILYEKAKTVRSVLVNLFLFEKQNMMCIVWDLDLLVGFSNINAKLIMNLFPNKKHVTQFNRKW